jgi:hypothetical protein
MPDSIPPPPPLPDLRTPAHKEWNKKLRVHRDILDYYKTAHPDAPLQEQIRLLAMRGTMARSGGVRNNQDNRPTAWIKPETPDQIGPKSAFYLDVYRPSEQAKYLAEAFDYGTPSSGSVFWSGIDKSKLKAQVNKSWNPKAGKGQKFGQLEATTDARFMDDAFVYKDSVKAFWAGASEQYGKAALGHVTAVQVFGLSKNTIFWKDELRAILAGMDAKLAAGRVPDVIDITIVVLEPVGSSCTYRFYTNLELAKASFYKARHGLQGYPKTRADCVLDGVVGHARIPFSIRRFWSDRGPVKPSPAALKIASDPSSVRYG